MAGTLKEGARVVRLFDFTGLNVQSKSSNQKVKTRSKLQTVGRLNEEAGRLKELEDR